MKKCIVFFLFLSAGVLVWLSVQVAPVAQGTGGQPDVTNACTDLNGDGRVDLSDPVFFLNWLFLGGAEPTFESLRARTDRLSELEESLVLCQESREPRLPASGQSQLFGNSPGQDGESQAGCPTDLRFMDNGDGTVSDACTGLMWQQATADTNDDGKVDTNDWMNWFDALAYCQSLSLAGHEDWRLPNVRELQSVVDYGRHDPALDPTFDASPAWYWTSTTNASDPLGAWYVDFSIGYVYRDNSKANRHFVLAVRDDS